MNNQQLSATAKKAHKAVGSITSRHGANFERRLLAGASADPDESEEEELVSSETEFQIWKLLPQLKGVPENFLEKLPLSAMFQLNSALQKERKNTEKLGVNARLAQNAKGGGVPSYNCKRSRQQEGSATQGPLSGWSM